MADKVGFYGGPMDGDAEAYDALEVRVVLAIGQVRLVAIYAFKGDRYVYERTQELGQSPSTRASVVIAKAVPAIYADGKNSHDGMPVRRWKWKKI